MEPIPKQEIEDTAKLLLEDNPRLDIELAVQFSKKILQAAEREEYDLMRGLMHEARHHPFVGADYLPRKVVLMGVQPDLIEYAKRKIAEIPADELPHRLAEKLLGDEDLISERVREKGRS